MLHNTSKRIEKNDAVDCARHGIKIESWMARVRRRNTRKNLRQLIKVTKDIDTCYVSETMDTHQKVIHLKDSRGNECSLWLSGDKVRSITPY